MALYAYCRVSTTQQAEDGLSLEVQGRQCEGWAMMQGEALTTVFVERGVSGSIPLKDRQAGAKLWATLAKGDVIVASKLDRVFRDARDALNTVEELGERGIKLVFLDLGNEPVSNGLGKFFMTIVAAFANMERERTKERINDVKRDQRERGRYLGGKVPFGFIVIRGDLVQHPEEQAVIASAKAHRASGMPLRAIQLRLQAEHGRKLSLDALSRIVNEG